MSANDDTAPQSKPEPPESRVGVSPYSTGGGGVTLERRVAAGYLALLLTGHTAPELGDARRITEVAFQQAPRVAVDDLVISAASDDEGAHSLRLAIGVRRRPNLVRSDESTRNLIVEYVRTVLQLPDDGREHRLGLAVGGKQTQTDQLAELADTARAQATASAFFDLLNTPNRFEKALVGRLAHVSDLVKHALVELVAPKPSDELVRRRTWELLRLLWVLSPRLEEPEARDWADVQNRLIPVAAGDNLAAAGRLRDRLEVLAGQYAPRAATIDAKLLRREVIALLQPARRHHVQGWALLDQMQSLATGAVRDHIGVGAQSFALDRTGDADSLLAAADASAALVVSGESGVGKSSLALAAVAKALAENPGEAQAVSLNLRQLPEDWMELLARLGAPLADVLAEMSAPRRYLLVDAADAAAESRGDLLSYLIEAATAADVSVIVVVANDMREVIHDQVAQRVTPEAVRSFAVSELSDEQLDQLVAAFVGLRRLAETRRSRELLRRLVVVDLLVRSGLSTVPLSDAEAMREVWAGLVRRRERRDRGLPDAREEVMLRLAGFALRGEAPGYLDAAALDGLRQDGLLRSAQDNPWQLQPEFAHDEIRRYAVSRVMLASGDVGAALLAAQAPRWALSASTLAAQVTLVRTEGRPANGRLWTVQESFDAVVAAGYGARWADVPDEALLGLGDPSEVLAEAWPSLRDDDGTGLKRLLRIIDQRHRSESSLVDPLVAEPVVTLLLHDPHPWQDSEQVAELLRDWLCSLAVDGIAAGHPLRIRLREHLVEWCRQGEARLEAERVAAAQRGEEREDAPSLASVLGGRRRRRSPRRLDVPREMRDDTVVELSALLGADIGEPGECFLRRLAADAPADLAPAVESPCGGRALAGYGRGLLADLVEAYYLNEYEDESGFHKDGIRRHRFIGMGPLAAWYRGPFMVLFQTDPLRGIAVLNRLLNHAARARARTLAGLGDPWGRPTHGQLERYEVELELTEQRQHYLGDSHVWFWYRGTGVGPYPCMSALQALERYCDQLLADRILPAERLVALLLDGCESLAMPALIVGLLVRHIDSAGSLLDPFLAEPLVWHLEFARVTSESNGLAAASDALAHPERRSWSLRDAAMWLTLSADCERADGLRQIGEQLVARAIAPTSSDAQPDGSARPSEDDEEITVVRAWASTLDRSTYSTQEQGDHIVVQSTPPQDVLDALESDNEDLRRGNDALQIQMRYFRAADPRRRDAPPTATELAEDLLTAAQLVVDPPVRSAAGPSEMAAAIAAYALGELLAGDVQVEKQSREFVVEVLLQTAERKTGADPFEFDGSMFELGADRSAARALPLLLLPGAIELRALGATEDATAEERLLAAGLRLAQAPATETRLFLAHGLDAVWSTPCLSNGSCHHQSGLKWAIESMRDCLMGEWDQAQREILRVADPLEQTLPALADEDILASKLDAGIRALGAASTHDTCVTAEARQLLDELLSAQRRSFCAHEDDYDERGSSALVAARALLALAATNPAPLREHLAAYADRSSYLRSLLRALAAAAEETAEAAQTARRLWPDIVAQVLGLANAGHETFSEHYGASALATLAPSPTAEIEFLYRELGGEPIAWQDPWAWRDSLDAWIIVASGVPDCIDSFISLVRQVSVQHQASFALARVAQLAAGDIAAAARRSYLLAEWLVELRNKELDGNQLAEWQRLVDALVVAGNRRLAPYSQ